MRTSGNEDRIEARGFLEKLNGGPLTFGQMIAALRKCDEVSQTQMAKKLGISSAKLCDIEKGRRFISIERAAQWARIFGHSEYLFVSLLLEDQMRKSGLNFEVTLKSKKKAA